jgi:hypothetical protein
VLIYFIINPGMGPYSHWININITNQTKTRTLKEKNHAGAE